MRAAILALAVLAGCATTPSTLDRAIQAAEKGDDTTAKALVSQAANEGDVRAWYTLGLIAASEGRRDEAIRYHTHAARLGLPAAQQELIRMGQPVPAPDLAAERAQRAANAAAAIRLMTPPQVVIPPIQMPPVPQQTNCTSRRIGNTVQTQCY